MHESSLMLPLNWKSCSHYAKAEWFFPYCLQYSEKLPLAFIVEPYVTLHPIIFYGVESHKNGTVSYHIKKCGNMIVKATMEHTIMSYNSLYIRSCIENIKTV